MRGLSQLMHFELTTSATRAADDRLATAQAIIAGYEPSNDHQAQQQRQMLDFVAQHSDALLRTCVPGHLTASAIVTDAARSKVLLTLHRKLGKWLQFGGHCDGDGNLLGCAWRETHEESGIIPHAISRSPIDLDVHTIPPHGNDPEHLHLDTRYWVVVPDGAEESVSAESIELGWFTPDECTRLDLDESVTRLIDLVF